jgi:hypothetical protein
VRTNDHSGAEFHLSFDHHIWTDLHVIGHLDARIYHCRCMNC